MLPKSEFSKNVLTVMSGTAAAQAIPILVAPILSRIYTPEEFGVFYLFSALAAILLVVSTGRYELAVLLPKKEKEAFHVLGMALVTATLFSIATLIIVVILNQQICTLVGEASMAKWLYILPFYVLAAALYNSFNYWHNRNKRFALLTKSKFVLSLGNAATRIGLGFLQWGTAGLIIGSLVAQILGFLYFLFPILKTDRAFVTDLKKTAMLEQGKRYSDFPKNMIAGSLFNTSSYQLPMILLNSIFMASIAGFYGLMQRIVRLPLAVIGKAFEEVFKQKASEEMNQFGHCRSIFFKTIKQLSLISLFPFILFFIIAPDLFRIVFGAEWEVAGLYARIFTIPFFIHFIVSSVSSVFYITEHTAWFTRSQFVQLALVLASFTFVYFYQKDAVVLMYLLAAAYSFAYCLMFILLLVIVNKTKPISEKTNK